MPGLIYVIAYILNPGGDPAIYSRINKASYFVHAIDIASGQKRTIKKVASTSPGWDDQGNPRTIIFDSTTLNQRPGLLLANNCLYAAFASLYGDQRGYHGWVFGFSQETLS